MERGSTENGCFNPRLSGRGRDELHRIVSTLLPSGSQALVDGLHDAARRSAKTPQDRKFRAACLMLADLVQQGWSVEFARNDLWTTPPPAERQDGESLVRSKERLRQQLLVARDRQLREPSVTKFLVTMERPRAHEDRMVSVLSLVDNGAELADALRQVAGAPEPEREIMLAQVLNPRLQFCDPEQRCETTGLLLTDVWRYFRLTWSLEYRSTPGRSLPFLVRNDGRPGSPVMGIGMIASAGSRIRPRDTWIGWDLRELEDRLAGTGHPGQPQWRPEDIAPCLIDAVNDGIAMIRTDDLATAEEIAYPTGDVIERLVRVTGTSANERMAWLKSLADQGPEERREIHALPKLEDGTVDWHTASGSLLFRKKRANALALLLRARLLFAEHDLRNRPAEALPAMLASEAGRTVLNVAMAELRKTGLAGSILDVNVCGAITPYNDLLGGKLVALLLGSQEAADTYYARYLERPSEIASQMAGREVRRRAPLLMLTTTSLYGVGSSQYNRLALRAKDHPELVRDLVWKELGLSQGVGTSHYSPATVDALRDLVVDEHGARRVNSVFGEGTNPRLRQMREGFALLGLAAGYFVRHAAPRIVYGCALTPDAIPRLMGFDRSHDLPVVNSVGAISAAWRRRWILNRISQPGVLDRISCLGPESLKRQFDIPRQAALPLEAPPTEDQMAPEEPFSPTGGTEDTAEMFAFVRNLYKSVSTVSDHHSEELLRRIHVVTPVETFVAERAREGRIVFLTGNPGDGKTHLVRMMEGAPENDGVQFIWDANDRSDEDLADAVDRALAQGNGLVIAINEGTLLELVHRLRDRRPWTAEVERRQARPVRYGDDGDPADRILIVDLNLRNTLDPAIAGALLDRLTEAWIYEADHGCEPDECPARLNAASLRVPEIRNRLLALLERIGRTGTHATMRDLASFFSFLVFGGATCEEVLRSPAAGDPTYAHNAFAGGEGELFERLRKFDPIDLTHPMVDDELWRGADREEEWVQGRRPAPVPGNGNPMPEKLARFATRKRRAYFELVSGKRILEFAPEAEGGLDRLVADPSPATVRHLVRTINRFFDRDDSDSERLVLWVTHRFDARPGRFAGALWRVPSNRLSLLVPRPPKEVEDAFPGYVPDHVLLALNDDAPGSARRIALEIDAPFLDEISSAGKGLPPGFRTGEPAQRLAAFFDRLAGWAAKQGETGLLRVEIIDMDSASNVAFEIDVARRKYEAL